MNKPVYIIAEAGVNHNGSIDLARQMIKVAAEAGADAIKFQSFRAEALVSKQAAKADYQKTTTGSAETQYDMLKKLELSEDDHRELVECCNAHGIDFLSTPFDTPSLKLLTEQLHLTTLKLPSGEITNLPFLYQAGLSQANIILSTGISTLGEIEAALGAIAFAYVGTGVPSLQSFQAAYCSEEGQQKLKEKVTLLHCTTDYPTSFEDVHLNKMPTIQKAFGLKTGYSDHTIGTEVSVAAVAMGAVVIEKHFTLDRAMEGPDHLASMNPNELSQLVQQIRNVESSLGISVKIPSAAELKNMNPIRKSLVAAIPIKKGDIFTLENITIKRPGTGLPPSHIWDVLGKQANKDFVQDDLIST